MSVQPQHQDNSRPLARGRAGYRPTGAPAYYMARPASLWLDATRPSWRVRCTQAAGG